jgi:hypothetical protein
MRAATLIWAGKKRPLDFFSQFAGGKVLAKKVEEKFGWRGSLSLSDRRHG